MEKFFSQKFLKIDFELYSSNSVFILQSSNQRTMVLFELRLFDKRAWQLDNRGSNHLTRRAGEAFFVPLVLSPLLYTFARLFRTVHSRRPLLFFIRAWMLHFIVLSARFFLSFFFHHHPPNSTTTTVHLFISIQPFSSLFR